MMVRVKYANGSTEMVRPPVLQHLIVHHKIQEFRRSDGWVQVDSGPIRQNKTKDYQGPERRKLN